MQDTIALAQRLVQIDTRAGNEKPAAELVADLLSRAGFDVRVDEPVPRRANVIARCGTGTPITLTGHLDTVPADPEDWSFDPFSGAIDNGRLLGRGSSDMKAGVACLVNAAIRHATEHPHGTALQLVLTFGEETGCDGARTIDRAALSPSSLLIVAEPTANRVVLGHKGTLWLRLTARGTAAHGSRPDLGDNALAALATAATRIHDHGDWPISPTHGPATVNVGTFHAGSQPNLVPDRAEMQLDVRTVPEFTSDNALTAISELAGPDITIESVLDLPGVGTSSDYEVIRPIVNMLDANPTTWQPDYATYFTDASVLADRLGEPAVILYGPGEPEQAHTVDESCPVTAITDATLAIRRLLGSNEWAAQPSAESWS